MKNLIVIAVLVFAAPAVAQEKYPGDTCERSINHIVRYARGVRMADDSITSSLGHMQRKEKAGDRKGVEDEREYMERVWARQSAQHSSLGGAIAMATALQCGPAQIEAAIRCGYERLGNGC